MKLIRIKYCPATNTRGSRWLADDGDHKMYGGYDYADDDGHDGRLHLAEQFAARFWRLEGRATEYKGSWKETEFYGAKETK